MSKNRLSPSDREFFVTLREIVFGNPFSAERAKKVARLVPNAPLDYLDTNREVLARVVGPRVEPWLREGAQALQKLPTEDRGLVELAG